MDFQTEARSFFVIHSLYFVVFFCFIHSVDNFASNETHTATCLKCECIKNFFNYNVTEVLSPCERDKIFRRVFIICRNFFSHSPPLSLSIYLFTTEFAFACLLMFIINSDV